MHTTRLARIVRVDKGIHLARPSGSTTFWSKTICFTQALLTTAHRQKEETKATVLEKRGAKGFWKLQVRALTTQKCPPAIRAAEGR